MSKKIQRRLGERIKLLRTRRDLTQVDVCDETGWDKSYLSRLENGRTNVTLEVLISLAETFEVNLATLVKGIDD